MPIANRPYGDGCVCFLAQNDVVRHRVSQPTGVGGGLYCGSAGGPFSSFSASSARRHGRADAGTPDGLAALAFFESLIPRPAFSGVPGELQRSCLVAQRLPIGLRMVYINIPAKSASSKISA